MAADDKVGSLEEQALKRKERLLALRQKKTSGANAGPESEKEESAHETLPKPVFRSYKPEDETLREATLPEVSPVSIEGEIKERIAVATPEDLVKEVDLSSLAPRKPDWDLKRDVSKKLDKLDKRTKRAIAELIRDRLRETGGNQDLAAAVNTASGPQAADSDED
ncbi:coiled-coil domain-containing protein 12 [Ixodes scapularis]|uniref:coiled-coil domain-containing protein 12 n=1 Tax=Ixodes scapularis TaxID=6945 RepID=UPI001A9D8681|nr:coiled-coil domain-containing protein 12 [Ixodes scapularis]